MTAWRDSLQRRDEVKAAFIEGYCSCVDGDMKDVANGKAREFAEAAWLISDARKQLCEKPLAD